MTLRQAIEAARKRASAENNVFMVLKHRNHYLNATVYYVYVYDGRAGKYDALVFPDGEVLYE